MRCIDVLIGGDICPIGRNELCFMDDDSFTVWHDLLSEFRQADYSIINLECPLITVQNPLMKIGPVLGVDASCIRGLKSAGINMVALANNHIMDNGLPGLESTLATCKKSGIRVVGAGKNLDEARTIAFEEIDGIRIGVLAVAEHEFSIATRDHEGANPLDLADYVRNLRSCRGFFDYLIVLVHGGNENYPYPSPRLMDICRFMVEEGANAVICQHSHCAGCYEEYLGRHIVYGQGNLVFYYPDLNQSFYEGFLVKIRIGSDFSSTMSLIPTFQKHETPGVFRMPLGRQDEFLKEIERRSANIMDPDFVEKEWMSFCAGKRDSYLGLAFGALPLLRSINRKNIIVKYLCSNKYILYLCNVIRCESHRDILLTLLEQHVKERQSKKRK